MKKKVTTNKTQYFAWLNKKKKKKNKKKKTKLFLLKNKKKKKEHSFGFISKCKVMF